jgi:hypothetical protein
MVMTPGPYPTLRTVSEGVLGSMEVLVGTVDEGTRGVGGSMGAVVQPQLLLHKEQSNFRSMAAISVGV